MDGEDILQQMGMQSEKEALDLKQFFFCKDVNVSGIFHQTGTYDGRMSMPMMIVMLVLGFVTFFVNLGVIIRTVKILRHGHDNKPAFYFIGNLALSDLAIGVYIIIAFLLHLTNKTDLWQQRTCTLQIAVAVTACQETIFTITLISVDKYLYICHALKYHQIVTMTRVYVAVVLSWIVSLVIGSLPAMGMLVKWEETCGRCIFAQVVSKDFAILFFITAVVLPYAVAVSLYSILLFLAIKMQKARYGGSYKASKGNEGRTSYFRLSNISKKSSRFRISSASTNKSITSKLTVSTTASNNSGVSISKSHRRRMRRQAMQEYKESLPGLEDKGNGAAAKLVQIKTMKTDEDLPDQSDKPKEEADEEIVVHLTADSANTNYSSLGKDEAIQNLTAESANTNYSSLGKDEAIQIDNEDHNSESRTDEVAESNTINHLNQNDISSNEIDTLTNGEQPTSNSGLSKDTTIVDVNDTNKPNSSTPKITEEQRPPSERAQNSLKDQNSDSHKPNTSRLSLSSGDGNESRSTDDESNFTKSWSLSKYFNRVVKDTKDKVLFLKKCQAVKTVFLIIGSFSVTYVPFVVGSLVYSLEEEKSKPLLHALQSVLFCAIVANSLVNPLLYAYGYSEFRIRTEKFKGVFAKKKKPKF